jgi:hypothetical protein
MDSDSLEQRVLDELGLDVYSRFETERYMLPHDVLRDIVVACLTAFVLGAFDFESAGKRTREALLGLVARFRDRSAPLGGSDASAYVELLAEARRSLSRLRDQAAVAQGTALLEAALIDYGMSRRVAAEHAQQLAFIFVEELQRGVAK